MTDLLVHETELPKVLENFMHVFCLLGPHDENDIPDRYQNNVCYKICEIITFM